MNKSNVSGKVDEIKGKIKQSVGEATGNDRMANSGAADQVKGSAKQVWGDAKDAVRDASNQSAERTDFEGHNTRDKVTNMARDVKDSVHDKAEDLRRKSA